jgi:alpha-L-fucosidase
MTGQRTELFSLEVKDESGKWQKISGGTTVGYKRIVQFEAMTAKELRLTISGRLNPTLAEFGLYMKR